PVVSVALASTMLGEEVHVYHIIGGMLVISGVILSQIKIRKKAPTTPPELPATSQ
ncbi:DMT family transporter, partial [Vibrio rotiferianus]